VGVPILKSFPLQFIFVVNVLQSVFYINLNGEGASPLPHSLEKFLFKKENDNVCELKGGVQ